MCEGEGKARRRRRRRRRRERERERNHYGYYIRSGPNYIAQYLANLNREIKEEGLCHHLSDN